MTTTKQTSIQAISSLPDDAPIDEVMYAGLYMIGKISQGQAALKDGRTIITDEINLIIQVRPLFPPQGDL